MKKICYSKTRFYLLFIFLIIGSLTSFIACSNNGGDGPSPGNTEPEISSISPTKGAIGADVTLKGMNFSSDKSKNDVSFGSKTASITSATETRLKVTVPGGLNAGIRYNVTETVDGQTATAPDQFTVTIKESTPDTADAVPRDGILEAVTWNLLLFGYTGQDQGPSDDERQLNNTIKIADSLNADLFAFQEIKSEDAIQKLAKRMKGYHAIFDETSNQGNAFVYNTNAIEPISSGDIKMGQNENDWAGRLPFYFSFNYKPGNGADEVEVYAVVIHAKAGADQDDYSRRKNAAQELYDYLTNQKPDAKIILLGDYNDEPNISIYNDQPSPYKPFVDDKGNYNVLTYALSTQENVSSETNFPSSVIDNITISNEMMTFYNDGSVNIFIPDDNFIPNYGNSTSDHYPVWATFDMTK